MTHADATRAYAAAYAKAYGELTDPSDAIWAHAMGILIPETPLSAMEPARPGCTGQPDIQREPALQPRRLRHALDAGTRCTGVGRTGSTRLERGRQRLVQPG